MAPGVWLSWAASWPCGDHAGVPAAPAGVMASPVEGTVLCARRGGVSRVLQAGVLLRSRHGPRSRVAPMLLEGSPVGKVRRKYGELAVQWREQCQARLAQGAAGSHSVVTVSGMAEQ